MTEEEKLAKAKKDLEKKANKGKLTKEFMKFITRGNIVDMAVGVIMGNAFGAIVTAFTNILLSLCTWGVPGGIAGLVTVLPALNDSQRVPTDVLVNGEALQQVYTASEWITLSQSSDFNTTIGAMYTQYGESYYYSKMAIIDWGSFINAIITFLIIAVTLFAVVKIFAVISAKRAAFEAALAKKNEEQWEKDHPEAAALKKKLAEEAKAKAESGIPQKADDIVLLEEIRDEIKRINTTSQVKEEPTA